MKEIWKDIEGFEGIYMVSSFGRIKSLRRPRKNKELILKPATYKGYHRVCLGAKEKTVKVHRLVALAFIPNPENKPQVNHKNGIKNDNRVENLEWSTVLENMRHAYRTGLNVYRREYHSSHMAELNRQTKRKPVIAELPDGSKKEFISCTSAGEFFGYTRTQISEYCRGKRNRKGLVFKYFHDHHGEAKQMGLILSSNKKVA